MVVMSYIYHTFFYNPIYNGLVFLIDIIPGGDAGIAVILLTIVVSVVLFSISKKSIKTQIRMKEMEPEMKKIKEEIKDRQEQAQRMMALYKKYEINPFSVILLVLIQLPVLWALYRVFLQGGLPQIHTELLYPFVKVPGEISMSLFGFFDITKKSLFFAVFAGVTQFIQAKFATSTKITVDPDKNNKSFKNDFAKSMNTQVVYVFPIIIMFLGFSFPLALPLYWSTRNIFMIFQEIYIKKNLRKKN